MPLRDGISCCPGGGVAEVATGDYVVSPYPAGGEVYSIKGPLFDSTYSLEDPKSRVPSHEEVLAEWPVALQKKEKTLHRKSEVVFAKFAGDADSAVQQKTVEQSDSNATAAAVELTINDSDNETGEEGAEATHSQGRKSPVRDADEGKLEEQEDPPGSIRI